MTREEFLKLAKVGGADAVQAGLDFEDKTYEAEPQNGNQTFTCSGCGDSIKTNSDGTCTGCRLPASIWAEELNR